MDAKASYSIANFAVKFCNELGLEKTTVCSPLSAQISLALLALGCRNKTREELFKALDFPDDDALRSTFGFLTSALTSVEGVTLNIANKLYIKKGGNLKPEIQKDAVEVFKSSLEHLDFSDSVASANVINNWVAEKTNNLIKEIVSPNMLNNDTRVVLLNAIYFLGTWSKPFYKSSTRDKKFHVNRTTTINVPQMYINNNVFMYGACPDLKAQILQMHYKGLQASMVIVLPDDIEGLGEVMQKLAAGYDLAADIETLKDTLLEVTIPKFKAELTIDLKEMLPKFGIHSIFNEKAADIDMLTSKQKLFVSKAVQKAVISVDETRTEAAACTKILKRVVCKRKEPKKTSFTADRPFLYLLTAYKIPLFIGIYEGSEYASKEIM